MKLRPVVDLLRQCKSLGCMAQRQGATLPLLLQGGTQA